MNNIVFQAYGSTDILNETIFSILSILKYQHDDPNLRIIIYSDNTDYIESCLGRQDRIVFEPIDALTLQSWRGEIGFVHRIKICMLQHYFSKYKEACLYLDSDTYALKDLTNIFQLISTGKYFMHFNEGPIKSSRSILTRKIRKFIRKNTFLLSQKRVTIPEEYSMWNAGALGLPKNSEGLLHETLELTDVMYKIYPKHVIEQLAFSYTVQKRGTPVSLSEHLLHYWNFKEFRAVLKEFFEFYQGRTLAEMISFIEQINPERLIQPAAKYRALPSIVRKIKKLYGSTWEMPHYTLAEK